jgi:hypothetical protein
MVRELLFFQEKDFNILAESALWMKLFGVGVEVRFIGVNKFFMWELGLEICRVYFDTIGLLSKNLEEKNGLTCVKPAVH